LEIVNVVASGAFDREFDLASLAERLNQVSGIDASHDESSSSLYIDFAGVKPLCVMYMSGSYSIRGGGSVEGVESVQQKLMAVLREAGISTDHREPFEVKNIVCIGELDEQLVLGDIQKSSSFDNAEFEPEQFPGLIYRDPETGGTAIIFSNGKVNITGLRSPESINQLFEFVRENI